MINTDYEEYCKKRFQFDDNDGRGMYCIFPFEKAGSLMEARLVCDYGIVDPDGVTLFPKVNWRMREDGYKELERSGNIAWRRDKKTGEYKKPYTKSYLRDMTEEKFKKAMAQRRKMTERMRNRKIVARRKELENF